MKHFNLFLSAFLCLSICFCLSTKAQKTFKEVRPPNECKVNHAHFKNEIRELKSSVLKSTIAYSTTDYVIPVVFHIFGSEFNGGSTVTQEIVENALATTNADFQGMTSDWNSINYPFDSAKQKLNITFKLAQKDANGNLSSGVIFHEYKSGFGNGSGYDEEIQKYAWDNYKYMNVYIMWDLYADSDYYNSGVAWYPTKWMSDANLARVVYNGSYLGSNTGENFRSVLTHEFGHFFNLIHTFDGGCTYPNDEVTDTPPVSVSLFPKNKTNCEGNLTNTQNFMNYSDNYAMFTQGQVRRMEDALQHTTRFPLWQPANIAQTLFSKPTARIMMRNSEIREAKSNNGSFTSVYYLDVQDAQLTANNITSSDYSVSGLPSGLSAQLIKQNGQLSLRISGSSANHAELNNVSFNLSLNSSLVTASTIYQTQFSLNLIYRNPYKIVSSEILNYNVDDVNNWKWFSFGVGDSSFGLWSFTKSNLKVQTYSKKAICVQGTTNIKILNFKDNISVNSSWVIPADEYKNVLDLRTGTYTDWQSKLAYVGVQFTIDGLTHYGWLKIQVSSDGNSATLLQWAYNEEPEAAIKAGQTSSNIANELIFYSNKLVESALNDGSVSAKIQLEVLGDTFINTTGSLHKSYFTVENLPQGLLCEVVIESNKIANIIFTGNAVNHQLVNSVNNIIISFNKTAFTNGSSSDLQGLTKQISLNFNNPYEIVYVDIPDIECNVNNTWTSFQLGDTDQWYGAYYDKGKLRLETYKKDVVCYKGTENIKLFQQGDIINWFSDNWEVGGDYPNEHNVVTDTYSSLKGKNGYIGLAFFVDGEIHYAWLHIDINAAGTSYKLLDYAYWNGPIDNIKAGQKQKNNVDELKSNFTMSNSSVEVGKSIVFSNTSTSSNTISDYVWTFEGGTPAMYNGETPPAINYTSIGHFSVSLNIIDIKNSISTKEYFIDVKEQSVVTYCIPEMNTTYTNLYIRNVSVNSASNESVHTLYKYFSEVRTFNLLRDQDNSIGVNLSLNWSPASVNIWIDWNKNGIFESTERVISHSQSLGDLTGIIRVPTDFNSSSTRMRVRLSYYNDLAMPCESENYIGEVEDYTIFVGGEHNKQFDFTASSQESVQGSNISFLIDTNYNIVKYNWTITGVENFVSTLANPSIEFTKPGRYTVKLSITDTNGLVKEIIKPDYVNILKSILKAEFSVSKSNILEAESVVISNNTSSQSNIITYNWMFTGAEPSSYVGKNPPVIFYAKKGMYDISLSVEDAFGNTSIKTLRNVITVSSASTETYCIPGVSSNSNSFYISKVTINNTSVSSLYDGYKFFDYEQAFALKRNSWNQAKIDLSVNWASAASTIWIDFNQDSIFDESEKVYSFYLNDSNKTDYLFVPSGALLGQTRMRVRITYYNKDVLACDNETYMGEIEDYIVNITDAMRLKSGISEKEGITDSESQNIMVYPNPSQDYVYVKSVSSCTIYVYDSTAKLIKVIKSSDIITKVSLQGLSKGSYIFKIVCKEGEQIRKIIKN